MKRKRHGGWSAARSMELYGLTEEQLAASLQEDVDRATDDPATHLFLEPWQWLKAYEKKQEKKRAEENSDFAAVVMAWQEQEL